MSTIPPSLQYSATDLTLIIAACSSAIVGIIAGFRLSHCRTIKCGCVEISRDVPPEKKNNSGITPPCNTPKSGLELRSPSGLTPSESELDLGIGVVV
jgi:hypothetical protein